MIETVFPPTDISYFALDDTNHREAIPAFGDRLLIVVATTGGCWVRFGGSGVTADEFTDDCLFLDKGKHLFRKPFDSTVTHVDFYSNAHADICFAGVL